MLNKSIISERVKKVADAIKKLALDGLLTTNPANVSYLTGFQGQDSWALLLGRKVWLLTDSRYTEQAHKECFGCRIIQRKDTLAEEAARLLLKQNELTLGLDPKISLVTHQTIKKHLPARLKPVNNVVEAIRAIKEPGERKLICQAAAIAREALTAALHQLRIGMTENEFAGRLELEIRRRNGHIGFETIVCFGPNGSRNHHIPGPRQLRQNDVMLVDYGASVMNYRCDITRSFGVNKVTAEYARAWQTVAAAQSAAIAAMRSGATHGDVDKAARDTIRQSGFPVYGHGSGHGHGLDIHEIPFLAKDKKESLQTGNIITIEPGIYLPGKWGIRLEDDVLITPTGATLLTRKEDLRDVPILTVK